MVVKADLILWLQTTQPTSGGAVTADSSSCANTICIIFKEGIPLYNTSVSLLSLVVNLNMAQLR